MGRETPMDREAADRIGAAAEQDPQSATAVSGFDERADAAAERNDPGSHDYDDDQDDDPDDN
ncbi:hypothetical protein [Streptomyces sp. NPDC017940]|uniref:hypothetical protein n=1 Tax=Streptomyces sp. NPDC017940 TaxID=3365017 RepID=UPI0037A2494D